MYLLAPIYYHFGHYPLVIEIITVGQEMGEIVFLFFLFFIFLSYAVYYRNYYFQVFSNFTFNLSNFFKNKQPLSNPVSIFFDVLKKKVSIFFKKIKCFFKKK